MIRPDHPHQTNRTNGNSRPIAAISDYEHRRSCLLLAWLPIATILLVPTFPGSHLLGQDALPTTKLKPASPKPGVASRTINLRITPLWTTPEQFWFSRENLNRSRDQVQVNAKTGDMNVIPMENADQANGSNSSEVSLQAGAPPRSQSSSDETHVTFVNRTRIPVTLRWVDQSGRPHTYSTIAPGSRYRQHTYAGHAWEVVDAKDRYYGSLVASIPNATVTIQKQYPTPPRSQPKRSRHAKYPKRDQGDLTSPDGKRQARLTDGKLQLRVAGTWETLAEATWDASEHNDDDGDKTAVRLRDMQFSPDGSMLVVWKTLQFTPKNVYLIESSPKGGGRARLHQHSYMLPGDPMSEHQLLAFNAQSGEPLEVDLPVIDFRTPRVRWLREHEMLIEKVDRGHQRFRLFRVDAISDQSQTLIDESSDTFLWTAHGPKVPLVTYLEESNEAIYASERSGWRHLYLLDLTGQKSLRPITSGIVAPGDGREPGDWLVREISHVDERARTLDLVVGCFHQDPDPYHRHHLRVDFNGEQHVVLTDGDGDHELQWSPHRRFVIATYSRVDLPPVHQLRRAADGKLISELVSAQRVDTSDPTHRLPDVFHAKGRDGETDIWGLITFPKNYDPNASQVYPVIENIYAGPHDSHVPKRYRHSNRFDELTSLGFFVVQIDGMGTASRSKRFHDVCWHDLKDAGFPDRIAWMKAAADVHPAMDLTRVGIFGTSAGGQNAAGAVIFHSDFYQAAVAACGCHDNRMDKASWNEQWMGYPVGAHYGQSSNIDNAERLGGDLLLIVGEQDQNVPPESTLRLVDALIQADKDFEFLFMPGMGHSDGGTYGRRRTREFFIRCLEPPNPSNSTTAK